MDDQTEESRWLSDGTMRQPEGRRSSFQGSQSRPNDEPIRILPAEERNQNDYIFVLSKFAESFVGADSLRKSVLLEELARFKATNDLEIENLELRQQLAREKHLEEKARKNYEKKQETYSRQISGLKQQIVAETKEKLNMMNTMVKLLEKEKNTRERILEYMDDGDDDFIDDKKDTELVKKDRLANHFEDVPNYKARLLEKMACSGEQEENEDEEKATVNSFERRRVVIEQGIVYHGNPKSLSFMHDIVSKLKKNVFPLDSQKRKEAIEEIAVYCQNKQATYLRNFGFVEVVVISLKSTDPDTQIACLAILAKLAQDQTLCTEMHQMDTFDIVKQMLVAQDDLLRMAALAVYEAVCDFESSKDKLLKRLIIMLEEYACNNIIRGVYLLWSIFSKTSTNPSCLALLTQSGLIQLVAHSLKISNSSLLTKAILTTLVNICEEKSLFSVESEPLIIESLLALLEKTNQENLLMVIRVLGSMRIESADGSNYDRSMKMIDKILITGMDAPNNVKFTILKVMDKLFSEESKAIASPINCQRILGLITAALENGPIEVKETASRLCMKMVCSESLEIVEQPKVLALIFNNCKLSEPEQFDLRQTSISILHAIATSVKYLNLIVLNSSQVLDTIRSSLESMHTEVAKVLSQIDKFKLRREEMLRLNEGEYLSVHEDDLISVNEKTGGLQIIADISLNNSKDQSRQDELFKRAKRKERKAKSVRSVDTENFFQDRSDVFSDFSDEDQILVLPQDLGKDDDEEENLVGETHHHNTILLVKVERSKEIYHSTLKVIKVASILLSCDIVYSKIFAYNLHAMMAAILEKSILDKELEVVDSLLGFFSTLFDIVYFRNSSSVSEPLVCLTDVLAKRFLIEVLRVIKRELDCKFSNWNVLCSTVNLIVRLFMKEETASALVFLERIIQKGLELKNASVLMMATILATHLSVYEQFHEFILIREFIAYSMGLLEPTNAEFIQMWNINKPRTVGYDTDGDSLLFLNRIMSNTGIVTQLAIILLNNLCASKHLAKILGSLPVKYAVKPLAKLFLIDRTKVSKLIQTLCQDIDFQSKIASFVPVNYAVTEAKQAKEQMATDPSQGDALGKTAQSLSGLVEESDTYDQMRELINNPRPSRVVKPPEYHENITKLVFMNSSVNDLIWRRMIKITMLNFKADPRNAQLWACKELRPIIQPIDYEKAKLMEAGRYKEEGKAPVIYQPTAITKEVLPEDSISGVHDIMGTAAPLRANNKGSLKQNTPMLEDYSKRAKNFDFKFDDFYYRDLKTKALAFADANGEDATKKNARNLLEAEMRRLKEFEEVAFKDELANKERNKRITSVYR